MKSNANPIPRPGERNVLCPHYEGCLDFAVEHRWPFWDCSICHHKSKEMNFGIGPMVKDPDPEYHVASGSCQDLVGF